MKRIGTVFLILFSFIAVSVQGQTRVTRSASVPQLNVGTLHNISQPALPPPVVQSVLATQYDTVALYDTSAGGLFFDPLNDLPNSPNSPNNPNDPNDSLAIPKSVDEFGTINLTGASPVQDTLYKRVASLLVTTPTDIKSPKLVNATVFVFPEVFDPRDTIEFWAVPIVDDTFSDLSGNVAGVYPVPDLFSASRTGSSRGVSYATGMIPANKLTVGQENIVTVNFGSKALYLGNNIYSRFAICAFDNGPGFYNDSLGFLMDFNPSGGEMSIDTDGTMNGGDSMVSYWNVIDGGTTGDGFITNNVSNFITGYYADANGDYIGNYVMNVVFSGTPAAVSENEANSYSLSENYPNPVSTTTEINYNLGQSGPVTLNVYNTLGQNVGTLVNSTQGAGEHTATFNAGTLPDGMYYYKLQSGEFTATNTMVIAR